MKSLEAAKTTTKPEAGEAITKPEVGKANTKKLNFPAFIPPISTSEIAKKTKRQSKFSAKGWEAPTKSMVTLCEKKIDDDDMLVIIGLARDISRASRCSAREADSDIDPDDSILHLGNGSAHSSDEDMAPRNFLGNDDDE